MAGSLINFPAGVGPMIDADLARFPAVRHDERIGKLERDLAKLEGIVAQLVTGMDAEHRAMKESRKEDRLALKELGEKMERSVSQLASEMQKMAERNSIVDNGVLAKQSQALGAIAVTRWIVGTIISAGVLLVAYSTGRNGNPTQIPAQQSISPAPGTVAPVIIDGQRYPAHR